MKKILVVDDSATSRMLFKVHFPKDYAAEIFDASTCADAVTKAVEIKPDVIFLDYNMPAKNGLEIAKEILSAGVIAKFVLLTANVQDVVIEGSRALGFVAVLEKPISRQKIFKVLEGLL